MEARPQPRRDSIACLWNAPNYFPAYTGSYRTTRFTFRLVDLHNSETFLRPRVDTTWSNASYCTILR